jgi:hypothetical protein
VDLAHAGLLVVRRCAVTVGVGGAVLRPIRAASRAACQDPGVPAVDLVDETFIVADRTTLAGIVADPRRWVQWWPDLALTVFMDRGLDGVRWSVSGRWVGSVEIWLEAVGDGVLVHHYARLDPVDPASGGPRPLPTDLAGWRRAARARAARAQAWKRSVWALKDELEAGREVGARRPGAPSAVADGPTGTAPEGRNPAG